MKIETNGEELDIIKLIAEIQEVNKSGYYNNSGTTITAKKDKLLIQASEQSQTIFIEAEIDKQTGTEEKIGINASDLATVLRALKGSNLEIETSGNELKITAKGNGQPSELTLYLEPVQEFEESNAVKKIEYGQTVKIEGTQDFKTGLRLAGLIDEKTVKFETTKDNLFLISSESGKGSFKRRIRIKDCVGTVGTELFAAFDRENLLRVIKARADNLCLHLGNNNPCLIEYNLGSAKVKVWIAQKIMEYEGSKEMEKESEEESDEAGEAEEQEEPEEYPQEMEIEQEELAVVEAHRFF